MDIIHLLSDHLANQIAAGEVIQRPASAVKELMENAIDAGATEIQLILKDAGKELIQVIDNGKGMSPSDARMSFERHATSKIRDINDLFAIRTMGFRGEALASIAAVAQVELKTRPAEQPVGTRILIEGTEVKLQEPAATSSGTNIMVKNLFFNVPARRHFLKSNTTELRHVVDEFTRITMANPDISFKMIHNGVEQFHLNGSYSSPSGRPGGAGALKTRIVGLLGNSSEKNLVPVNEETEFLTIRGFIGKPNVATRTRGNQFFFINNRFIRNAYLHHAVTTAYEGLLAKDSFPFYVLFLETDPARVDVNVHPTKQEVKFEDDRLMYAYLQAAVKHALAKHNIAPSLDFTLNPEIQSLSSVQLPQTKHDQERVQGGYLSNSFADKNQAHKLAPSNDLKQWKELYKIAEKDADIKLPAAQIEMQLPSNTKQGESNESTNQRFNESTNTILSIQGSLLATTVKSGIMLIHLRRAQERIWHQRLSDSFVDHAMPSQQLLYAVNLELPPAAATILSSTLPELQEVGFDISHFGGNSFVVQGVPAGVTPNLAKELIETIVDRLSHENPKAADLRKELLLNTLAFKLSYGTPPSGNSAQQALIDELFACDNPEYTPGGKKVFRVVSRDELDKLLN